VTIFKGQLVRHLFRPIFMLVAAMNPVRWIPRRPEERMQLHFSPGSALSTINFGPLMDRIDIHMEVPPVQFRDLAATEAANRSAEILARSRRQKIQRSVFRK